jgi:hypothetical protein
MASGSNRLWKAAPDIEGWRSLNITERDGHLYFGSEPKNLGVMAGDCSKRLAVVLPQSETASAFASHLMPYTGALLSTAGVASAYLYDTVFLPRRRPFVFSDVCESGSEIPLIKLVGDGLPEELVLFPPSITASGQAIDWHLGTISRVDPLDLLRRSAARRPSSSAWALAAPRPTTRSDGRSIRHPGRPNPQQLET